MYAAERHSGAGGGSDGGAAYQFAAGAYPPNPQVAAPPGHPQTAPPPPGGGGGVYVDPRLGFVNAVPPPQDNPVVALTMFDLPPPTTLDSLPETVTPEMDELAQLTALALQHRCERMRAFERCHQSIFHSSRVPGISVWDYTRRMAKYSGCSPECFVIALILLDRYSQATRIPLSFRNIHRLSITAVMVSAKLRDDIYYSNAYYASIGGVSPKELSHLELELLSTVQWWTWVEPSVFFHAVEALRRMYGPFLPPVESPAAPA